MADLPIAVAVLGPLELRVADVEVRVGSAKVRSLLARLVLGGGQAVSSDQLVAALWGDGPPRTAAHAVQVHVSSLRRVVRGAGAALPLATTDHGYVLAGAELTVDAWAFERELSDGRAALLAGSPEAAASLLEQALDRWRGDPYRDLGDGVASAPEVVGERARLLSLRADAEEELAEAGLAAGRHAQLVADLEAAIRREPLRERRYQQLMVALYRAGRTSDALAVFQQARAALTEELGIEPGPLLRETEWAVLNHEPSLFPGPAGGATAPVGIPARAPGAARFVGRAREWSRLSTVVASGATRDGRIVLVGGPPGIGKTRLVHEVVAAAGPFAVARGACPEGGVAPPLWPITEALRDLGPASLPAPGSGLDDEVLEPLRAAVEGRIATAAAITELPTDEHAAFRLHEAVAGLLASIAAQTPLVLVLDDLHAADAATMGALGRVAPLVAANPLVVLATHRDTPADHSDSFAAGLAVLVRLPTVERLALGPLEIEDVASFLTAVGLEADRLAAPLHRRSEGSPLLMTELVHLLVAHDGDPAALEEIPEGLAAVLEARLEALGPARGVVERAAVIGSRFDLDVLARVADVGTDRLLEALGVAEAHGIIDRDGGVTRRFRHALVAEAAVAALPEADRIALHLRIAEVLERSSGKPSLSVTEAARHRVAALPAGDPRAAAAACLAAAEMARSAMADAETRWFAAAARRALDLCEDVDDTTAAHALTLEGEARIVLGEDARHLLEAALEHARRSGDAELVGHAVRSLVLHRSVAAAAGDADLVVRLEEAIRGLEGRGGWLPVQLATDLAMALYRTPEQPRSVVLCEEALARARVGDDPVALAFALTGLHQAISEASYAPRRLELAEEAVRAAQLADLVWHEAMATAFRGCDRWELGDLEGASRDLERSSALAEESRRARVIWIARSWQTLLAIYRGETDRAARLRADALAAWGPESNPDALLCDLGQRMLIGTLAGEVEDLVGISRFQRDSDAEPLFWESVIAVQEAQRLPDPAAHASVVDALDRVLVEGLDGLLPTVTRLPTLALLAEAAALVGHEDAGRAVLPALEPYAGRHVLLNVFGGGGLCWGVADQGLALAAAVAGHREAAERWQRCAEEALSDTGGVTFLRRAKVLWDRVSTRA